ncbi:MAG: hypothetical protein H0V60_12440 [Actinobacteria bacterium]|nr:hypothetical protein [Actinomycetota bacterium]
METPWLQTLLAAALGGLTVKLLDIAWAAYIRRSEASASAKKIVARHLDPILKAADELVGKLCSLARKDFTGVVTRANVDRELGVDFGNILYLFAQFWCRIEILRKESVYVEIGRDATGDKLRDFFACLESTGVRVVDRAYQRGIGEALITERGTGGFDCMSFHDFMEALGKPDATVKQWTHPLTAILWMACRGRSATNMQERQRVLLYGVVIHALIDTLDPEHETASHRPSYPNKLSKKTRKELQFRVFKTYLPFVKATEKYTDARRPSVV